YYYYVHDNQGSVRAVLNERGELTQATDYSAYGVPSSRYAGTAANNRLHLGLEWQPMKGLSGYYNNARFRDALLVGMFYQQDPLAEKYHPFSPYHYGANNPNKYIDKNGEALEVVWDIANIAMGAASMVSNIASGNYVDAAVDGLGLIADAAAAVVPFVPGGAGSAIKATRAANKMHMHHIIPNKHRNHRLVQAAETEGFKFNGKENLIELESFSKKNGKGRHANHPKYSKHVKDMLDDAEKGTGTPRERLQNVIEELNKKIIENPDKKINDLFEPKITGVGHQRTIYFKGK
ncbi:MAG: AHH domain-containing protein, partial [Muribaculaceae bacterium]|nr:AHH domain-containing protein [Muribaculaceae bacterium]